MLRFDHHREAQSVLHFCLGIRVGAIHDQVRRYRQVCIFVQPFGLYFVDTQCTAEDTTAVIGNIQQVKESLNGAVFAVTSVEDDESYIDVAGVCYELAKSSLGS